MSAVRAGRVLKSRRRPNKAVLRMMAIMTDGNKEQLPKEFVEGGRTGRRNAMPDILHSDANVTTADLPDRLQQLATSVEVQSASSPSTDSYSSGESGNVLMSHYKDEATGVSDLRCENELNIEYIPRTVVPPGGTQVIQLDERNLMEMLHDPNNPQPGPSSDSAQPPEENKDDEHKGS